MKQEDENTVGFQRRDWTLIGGVDGRIIAHRELGKYYQDSFNDGTEFLTKGTFQMSFLLPFGLLGMQL